jgi:hypothetical protein
VKLDHKIPIDERVLYGIIDKDSDCDESRQSFTEVKPSTNRKTEKMNITKKLSQIAQKDEEQWFADVRANQMMFAAVLIAVLTLVALYGPVIVRAGKEVLNVLR